MNPNRYLIDNTKRWSSVLDELRKEKKITEEFEILLNDLPLEDIIALKLELSCRTQKSPVYGIPIWKNLTTIVRDATLKFAISSTNTPSEAARVLGLRLIELKRLIKHFQIFRYVKKPKKK